MVIQFEKKDKVGIVTVQGRIDAVNVGELKTKFNEWLNETNQFILDMKNVDFIDSTGLGGIVACLKYSSEAGGDLKIVSLQSKPRMVFEITRAYKIFDIYDDLQTAIDSMK
jgi:anti-sigma B factor antagonist